MVGSSSKARDAIGKAVSSAGKTVKRMIANVEKKGARTIDGSRPEICVGATVSLSADAHRHGAAGGNLAPGETGTVIEMVEGGKARVRSQAGIEFVFDCAALKAYARTSRAVAMISESIYFPALAVMLFEAAETNEAIKSVLLNQTAIYARSLRPLELFNERISAESLKNISKFLVGLLRTSKSPNDTKLAFEALVALTVAEGSVSRNIQLGLIFSARPDLVNVTALQALTLISDGAATSDDSSSSRARDYLAALEVLLSKGGRCSSGQAVAALFAHVELVLDEAEHARKHRGKISVPHVSEIDALRPLLDFIDLVGSTRGALDAPDVAWELTGRSPAVAAALRERAEQAHSVLHSSVPSALKEAGEDAASDRTALAMILSSSLRLVAANLALSIHVPDELEVDPVENLDRSRCLLRSVVGTGASSVFFGPLCAEDRAAVRELALTAYDVGGEAFFKDSSVMTRNAKEILLAPREASVSAGDAALDLAVLRVFARPQVLLPLLLDGEVEARREMAEIVDAVGLLQFRDFGRQPPGTLQSSTSSISETVEDDWNFSLCHRASVQLSKKDRRVYKSDSNPDYSCAMSSEPFTEGSRTWEINYECVGSSWVGVAGESTRNYLGSSPTIEYGATLHNGGSWNLYGGLVATKQESASFTNGSRIKMVLNFDEGTFDMYVNDDHKLSVNNVDGRPLHAYVCMDSSGESFELMRATQEAVSVKCSTMEEAVQSLVNTIVRLETGIFGSSLADSLPENYGSRMLAQFCTRLEAILSEVSRGELVSSTVGDALVAGSAQLCVENIVALASQMCGSPVLGGDFSQLTRLVRGLHGVRTLAGLGSDHWLSQYLDALVAVMGPEISAVVWGERLGQGEDWLHSPLLAKGFLESAAHAELLVGKDEPSIFDSMLQPRVAVLTSPYLDLLERRVIIAILYHIGVLDNVVAGDTSEEQVATCQNASMVARQIRRQVMEIRNLANQSLGENEKPQDWDVFVKPFLDKCDMLLEVPPLCPSTKPTSGQSQKKLVAAALLVKRSSSKAHREQNDWDKVLTTVQAHKVLQRMHSQNIAATPQTRGVALVARFLRDVEALAHNFRERLNGGPRFLSASLRSCSAFDSLLSILDLRDTQLLSTLLQGMFKRKKLKSGCDDGSSTAVPEDWGRALISSVTVSSNQSESSKLTDQNPETFWQSNGSCPHWIRFKLEDAVQVSEVGIIVANGDASYCPLNVRFLAGESESSLKTVEVKTTTSSSMAHFAVSVSLGDFEGPIGMVQISIESNQQSGCDTRVHGVFVKSSTQLIQNIWTDDLGDAAHRQRHYLENARGTGEAEIRDRFNRCARAMLDMLGSKLRMADDALGSSAMEFLSVRLDRADLDFLAAAPLESVFATLWAQVEAELARVGSDGEIATTMVYNFGWYARWLRMLLEQVGRLGSESNPLLLKTVMEASHSATSRLRVLLRTPLSKDAMNLLEGFGSFLLQSVTKAASAALLEPRWQDVLWDLAASPAGTSLRLSALQLIRAGVLRERPVGDKLTSLLRRLLGLVAIASPEATALSTENAVAVPDIALRSEALGLVAMLGESQWAGADVAGIVSEGLRQSPTSQSFLAAVMALGGSLDHFAPKDDGGTGGASSFCTAVSTKLVDAAQPLMSRVSVLGLEKALNSEGLAEVISAARVVKAIWQSLPESLGALNQSAGMLKELAAIASQPRGVPFTCFQMSQKKTSSGTWTWGPYEPNNIRLSEDKLTARNASGSGPDYSCVLGSELFTSGEHMWEIEVQNVNSMWLGIARGVEEGGGLASSPGQNGDFQLYFASGGGCSSRGSAPNVTTEATSAAFPSGSRVRFELNVESRTLRMSVNGDLKFTCTDVDCSAGVVPYLCSDYTESAVIVSRTSPPSRGPPLTLEMLVSKSHALLPTLTQTDDLRSFLSDLEFSSPEMLTTTLEKLRSAALTKEDLTSPSLTTERLKALGLALGPRKAILERRDQHIASATGKPSLQQARALAQQHGVPVSACLKALGNNPMDAEDAVRAMAGALGVTEQELTECSNLCRRVDSDDFVLNGMPRAPGGLASSRSAGKPKRWATRGSPVHLIADVERAILTTAARLVVHEALARGSSIELQADAVEHLFAREFSSPDHPLPRSISSAMGVQQTTKMLHESLRGWIFRASSDEVVKLRALSDAGVDRYCVRQKLRRGNDAAPNGVVLDPQSEEDSLQSGIGFALLVLSCLAQRGENVTALLESVGRAILLTPCDGVAAMLWAVCRSLEMLPPGARVRFGDQMMRVLRVLRKAVVTMVQTEAPKVSSGVHHSTYVQDLQESISFLELLSEEDCFGLDVAVKWGYASQGSTELKLLFKDDMELVRLLGENNLGSHRDILALDDSAIESLPATPSQTALLRALRQRSSRDFFLPGDVVRVSSLASLDLETLVASLGLPSKEVETDTLTKLRASGLRAADFMSDEITGDQLKNLGLALGPRKALLQRRDNETALLKVFEIRKAGAYAVGAEGSEPREVHYCLIELAEGGALYTSLSELGFVDREVISRTLVALKLESFSAGLDTADGQRLIDSLTGSVESTSASTGDSAGKSSLDPTEAKARSKMEDYTKTLAVLRSMGQGGPFPKVFEDDLRQTFKAQREGEASWVWGAYEPTDISITGDGLKATKNYVTGPDYSCALGSEEFVGGIHTWELEIDLTKASSFSMWAGIARGVEEKGGLGSGPSDSMCDFLIAFHNGGNDVKLAGREPTVDVVYSYQYQQSNTLLFELDMEEHVLRMSVNGRLCVVARNVDDVGVRPFVCFDYSESANIKSRTHAKPPQPEGAEEQLPEVALSEADILAALDNSQWSEEVDSVLARMPQSGKVAFYDEATVADLRDAVSKLGGRFDSLRVETIAARLNAHAKIKALVLRVMPLIRIDAEANNRGHLLRELFALRARLSSSTFASVFKSAVQGAQSRNTGSFPSVTANRGIVPAEQRRREKTVFFQIFTQVEEIAGKAMLNGYGANDAGKQFWKMSFEGEGGIDAGGLFRDSVREICAELQSEGSLKLLLPFPNQKRLGSGQGRWIVNSSLTSKEDLELYRFLGSVLGASLLWEASVELDLASIVWKRLIGQEPSWADLVAVDEAFCKRIVDGRGATEEEWVGLDARWVVAASSGRTVELRRGGSVQVVSWTDREAYLDACVDWRLREGCVQIEAMRAGFLELVPSVGLEFVDWHEVEKLVCGTPAIDVELLKRITTYNNMEGGEAHPVSVMFWNVMAALTNEERAQIMAFSWGRRRMPPQVGGVHFKLCIDGSLDDRHMPRSHTCFFALDLPRYTSEERMREKLLYAAKYCSAIDNDTSASGQLYTDDLIDMPEEVDTDSVIPFDDSKSSSASSTTLVTADGGHDRLLAPGTRCRAPPTKGVRKTACTVLSVASAAGPWATCPVRYRVQINETKGQAEADDEDIELIK